MVKMTWLVSYIWMRRNSKRLEVNRTLDLSMVTLSMSPMGTLEAMPMELSSELLAPVGHRASKPHRLLYLPDIRLRTLPLSCRHLAEERKENTGQLYKWLCTTTWTVAMTTLVKQRAWFCPVLHPSCLLLHRLGPSVVCSRLGNVHLNLRAPFGCSKRHLPLK